MSEDFAAIPIANRWRGQLQPTAVVISIIYRTRYDSQGETENEYLLIRRKAGPYSGYWALVGGKWDFGESLSNAALREIEEETRLVCSFDSLLGVVNERVETGTEEDPGGAHFLLFVCLVDSLEGEAEERDEGEVAWFYEKQIAELNRDGKIIPSDYAMFAHFRGANPLPYIEVVMESSALETDDTSPARLKEFTIIS